MLLKENFSEEYIRSLQKDSKRDPVLLERTVYAFGLLEALARVRIRYMLKVYVTYVDIFMQKTIVRKLQQGEQPWLCTW